MQRRIVFPPNKQSLALCVPAYNAAAFLPRLLESASNQTVPFDEILVYDDCSPDNTGDVAARYGAKVVRGETNRGCSFGKNHLAELTRCEWIHFHDADDALYPNFVERARKWMAQEHPPDVVLFAYEWRDNATQQLLNVRRFDDEQLRRDPISYTIREQINPFCGLYKREAFLRVGGYDLDPEVLYNEDVAMHCQLARGGLKFAADPTVTVINYHIPGSMSSANRVKCTRANFHVLRKAAQFSGNTHAAEIGSMLWGNAVVAASNLDWETAYAAIRLAESLGQHAPEHESAVFKITCRVNPYLAVRGREHLIRLLKPHLREGYQTHPLSPQGAQV